MIANWKHRFGCNVSIKAVKLNLSQICLTFLNVLIMKSLKIFDKFRVDYSLY